MSKARVTGYGVGLLIVLTALPVHAQAGRGTPSGQISTLVLSDGERTSGELVELDARGYTLRINGQDRVFPTNTVAAIEFIAPTLPTAVQSRIDGGESLVVLRSGQIIPGRLVDIGGNQPKRLTVDTPSGQRVFLSNTVAQIYLFPVKVTAAARASARMRFAVMDLDNDGVITRDEWRGSPRSFQVHDWNGDGRLSGDEVRIGARQDVTLDEADHAPSWSERYVAWTDAGFTSLDHNRDLRITPNEWHDERETFLRVDRNRDGALTRAEFLGGDMDDDRGDQFEDLDGNRNGRIERAEWHASEDAFMWLDRNRDGTLSRLEMTGEEAATSPRDQFANLDSDGNGTIARSEWHWSLGSFDRWDVNRDGVLTRQEFTPAAESATASPSPSQVVRVNSQREWTDTGVIVRAGDVVTFNAQGSIRMSPDVNDIATPAGARSGRRASGAPVTAPAGALIARIGDAAPFVVGDRRSMTAPVGGRLYLGVNDDHLPDNTGEFEVTVAIQRPAPDAQRRF